jgi:hypothetical protein
MKKTNLKEDFGLDRFKAINLYADKLITEQAPPPPPPDPNATTPPPPGGEAGATPPPAAGAEPGLPGGGAIPPPPDEAGAGDTTDADAGADAGADTGADADAGETDETKEIDITDLVNMTKSIKKQLDASQSNQNTGATEKMDQVFSKLGELEGKLGEMDQVLAKIDQLGVEIQDAKPKTPIEKLEMRSLDSYPFSKKPDEFFKEKQEEMRKTGKNEYVLTKGDVENYGKYDVMKSFNPEASENSPR